MRCMLAVEMRVLILGIIRYDVSKYEHAALKSPCARAYVRVRVRVRMRAHPCNALHTDTQTRRRTGAQAHTCMDACSLASLAASKYAVACALSPALPSALVARPSSVSTYLERRRDAKER